MFKKYNENLPQSAQVYYLVNDGTLIDKFIPTFFRNFRQNVPDFRQISFINPDRESLPVQDLWEGENQRIDPNNRDAAKV